jgi:hypothetical protein
VAAAYKAVRANCSPFLRVRGLLEFFQAVEPKRTGMVIARPFDQLVHLGDHGA